MCPPKRPSVVRFFYINGAASRSIAVRQSRSFASGPSQPQASSSKAPLLFFLEHHHPMPTDEFLSGFPQPEPSIQEDPVDIFEHDWALMPLDDFLAAMRLKKPSPEEAALETAAGFQAPHFSPFPAGKNAGDQVFYAKDEHSGCGEPGRKVSNPLSCPRPDDTFVSGTAPTPLPVLSSQKIPSTALYTPNGRHAALCKVIIFDTQEEAT